MPTKTKLSAGKPKPQKLFLLKGQPKPKGFLDICSKAKQVSLGKDQDGFFVYTHRWQSKSYKNALTIPAKVIDFCESTE